jgi:ribosome-associated translation inhibitor RaiA
MTQDAQVVIHFKDLKQNDVLDEALQERCHSLAEEFPETTRYEITISLDKNEVNAHAHVKGKNTSLAAQAVADNQRQASEVALDRLERELRKERDKRIFSARREAKRTRVKRSV